MFDLFVWCTSIAMLLRMNLLLLSEYYCTFLLLFHKMHESFWRHNCVIGLAHEFTSQKALHFFHMVCACRIFVSQKDFNRTLIHSGVRVHIFKGFWLKFIILNLYYMHKSPKCCRMYFTKYMYIDVFTILLLSNEYEGRVFTIYLWKSLFLPLFLRRKCRERSGLIMIQHMRARTCTAH